MSVLRTSAFHFWSRQPRSDGRGYCLPAPTGLEQTDALWLHSISRTGLTSCHNQSSFSIIINPYWIKIKRELTFLLALCIGGGMGIAMFLERI